MTPGGHHPDVWAARIAAAPRLTLADLVTQRGWSHRVRLLALAAHPDDETLGAGRFLQLWSRRGPVAALTATAGEACFDQVLPRPDGIAERRLHEWRQALAALGVEPLPCPRLPDGALTANAGALARALESQLATTPPEQVVLAAPWRHDPHPDHAAAGRVAARIADRYGVPLVEYPVWMTYWSDPEAEPHPRARLIRIESDAAAERAVEQAGAAFVSQLTAWTPDIGPVLPAEMLRHHNRQLLILEGDP